MKWEVGIPFAAWIIVALLVHLLWSTGAEQLARITRRPLEEKLASSETGKGGVQDETEIEVSLEPTQQQQVDLPNPHATPAPAPTAPAVDLPEKQAEKLPEPTPDRPHLQVVPVVPTEQPPPPPKPSERKPDQRIAVEQHVKPGQEDNPNAEFVGDEANHVKEQTVARITNHDRNDPDPTPGGQHSSPDKTPGNADEDRIADDIDRPGDPDKAPGDGANKATDTTSAGTAAAPPPNPPARPPTPTPSTSGGRKPEPHQPTKQNDPSTSSRDAITGNKGSYSLDPTRKKSPSQSSKPSQSPPTPYRPPFRIGLGAGPTADGVQMNLSMNDVVATVGVDELARQRHSDGERRRSKHRGSWQASDFSRWKASIENYVSSVRPGNQTALNTARVPFASYLVRIHNRIHPIFADTFLASLDALPPTHAMNNYKLITRLEIIVEPESGQVLRMGVIKTSGITAFDVGALDSVQRSSPFGKAPPAIISTDGRVYLHWEFHRNPIYACSTMNARPYMLKSPPQPAPGNNREPSAPQERGVPSPSTPNNGTTPSRYGQRSRTRDDAG